MAMPERGLSSAGRILVRGLNWIGDAVMSLPTIWKIREAVPDARLTLASPGWSADIYCICTAVDEVIQIPPKGGLLGLPSEFKAARLFREDYFDLALILPNSFRSALAPFLAGVKRRTGYGTGGRGMLLTEAVSVDRAAVVHTVHYYRPLLSALDIHWEEGSEKFGLELDENAKKTADGILKREGVDPAGEIIGFSPGAAWGPSKRWPAESFAKAASNLCSDSQRQAIFFGSTADSDLIADILEKTPENSAGLAGTFARLHHLAAAISRCRLLVTNDSGPMHLAAALGVPVVALFGPTDERISGPWTGASGKAIILRPPDCLPCYNPRCRMKGTPCLARIAVEEVVEAAEKLLSAGGRGESM